MMENAKKGYWNGGYPPLGYVVEKDKNGKGKLKVDPVWAPVVKKIFDLSYKGVGPQRICQILLKEGIKNKNGKPGSMSKPVVKISWGKLQHYFLCIKLCISHTKAYPF